MTLGVLVRNGFLRAAARFLACGVVVVAMAWLAACGGKSSTSSSSTTVAITISPTTASLAGTQTQQFTATVTGNSNTAVTWQVNGVTGGDATNGTISTSGLYSAPVQVPNPSTVTVIAISQADTTKAASASVTITASANIVVTPNSLTMAAGAQQTFAATVNTNPASPAWSVHCLSQATGACGTITSTGIYTAPLSPPPGGGVTITATATDNTAITGSVNILVQFSNASLSGAYAFGFTGQSGGKFFAETGSVSFDGAGNVRGGTEDVDQGASATVAITGGTYTVGVDGRGSAVIQTANGPVNWQFVLANHGRGVATRFDAAVTASGSFDLQDPRQFTLASVRGGYALLTSGVAGGSAVALAAGLLTDGTGAIGAGTLDVNAAANVLTNLTASGSFSDPSASTAGRGTLTLTSFAGTQTFAYYIVDAARIKLIETDGIQFTSGDLVAEPTLPFALGNFRGNFVFSSALTTASGASASAGTLTLDGSGAVTAGSADTSGATLQTGQAITGTYAAPNLISGRSAATWTVGGSAQQLVLYPRADGGFNFVRLDAGSPSHGVAFAQPASSFSPTTLSGNFVANLTGATASGEADMAGQLAFRGGTSFTGVLAVNDNGATTAGATLTAGAYAVNGVTGRGTAALTSTAPTLGGATLFVYIIDSNRALLLSSGGTRPLAGFTQFSY